MVDDKCFLVNLNADPALNELLVYYLKVHASSPVLFTVHVEADSLRQGHTDTYKHTCSATVHLCLCVLCPGAHACGLSQLAGHPAVRDGHPS